MREPTEAEMNALIAEAMPSLREDALGEWSRRNALPAGVDFTVERTWLDKQQFNYGEQDYRRGYLHGYSQGIDDMLDANPRAKRVQSAWQELAKFFDAVLMPWRHRTLCDEVVIPPTARPKAKRGHAGTSQVPIASPEPF